MVVKKAAIYVGMLVAAALLFHALLRAGVDLTAPPPSGPPFGETKAAQGPATLMHVLLSLVAIIALSRLLGEAFKRIHQPPVIGEVVAGIVLGPSLLGRVWPEATDFIFPAAVAPLLGVVAQVGVILYMFLVGLELDTELVRKRAHASVAVSHASIVLPFLLGGGLAYFLYPRLSTSDVPFTVFALFLGVAMSVTAFPVLARILTDRGMHTSKLGTIALSCAAVDDVTAWCLLAFVVGVVQSKVGGAVITVGLSLAYIGAALFVVRPLLVRVFRRAAARGGLSPSLVSFVFVGLLVSALATEAIGIHAVFGAFLLGAILPREAELVATIRGKLHDVVVVLLLPAFYAYTGMRTQIGLVSGPTAWLLCLAIIAVASLGKFGGTLVAARATGFGWRDAASLGILMNTRGLMELIVLNIGLELHVLSPVLFAMLVLMAIATTVATTPVLSLLSRVAPVPGAAPAMPRD